LRLGAGRLRKFGSTLYAVKYLSLLQKIQTWSTDVPHPTGEQRVLFVGREAEHSPQSSAEVIYE